MAESDRRPVLWRGCRSCRDGRSVSNGHLPRIARTVPIRVRLVPRSRPRNSGRTHRCGRVWPRNHGRCCVAEEPWSGRDDRSRAAHHGGGRGGDRCGDHQRWVERSLLQLLERSGILDSWTSGTCRLRRWRRGGRGGHRPSARAASPTVRPVLRRKKGKDDHEPPDPSGLRRFVFGDCPVDEWPPTETAVTSEPWQSFALARSALERRDQLEATRPWQGITSMPSIESRHVLQAWHFLRSIGIAPEGAVAKHVVGAVAEVALPQGHDLLAAYEDGSVRYLNNSGAVAVIDEVLPTVEAPARDMLRIGQAIVQAIGPWEGPLPPLPTGYSRLTLLTPLGPHFGQGPDVALRADQQGAAFLDAATRTLLAVVEAAGH